MRAIPVRFDDRLQTVLRQPSAHAHDVAVRWRQLVDLVARAGPETDPASIADAIAAIRQDRDSVDEAARAAAARAVASLPLPRALFVTFLEDNLSVSAPLLAAARLSRSDWDEVLSNSPSEVARFVAAVHPETAPIQPVDESPEPDDGASPARPPAPTPTHPTRTIGDVIERIERRRERRTASATPASEGPAAMFRFECEPSGEIAWVEGAPRGALVGRSLLRGQDSIEIAAREAFEKRAPFHDEAAIFAGDGAIGGEWRLSAVPAFDPAGHFEGYRGIARRPGADLHAEGYAERAPPAAPNAVKLRELVHELRTPINAIVGFGEIIDGQYLGPAGLEYRQRAGAIVAEARFLLEAIEDLDLVASAAATASGHSARAARSDLAAVLNQCMSESSALADARGVELAIEPIPAIVVALPEKVTARLAARFLAAIAELGGPGERLRLVVEQRGRTAALIADQPHEAVGSDEIAFPLRLVRGLARLSGGDLSLSGKSVIMTLPLF